MQILIFGLLFLICNAAVSPGVKKGTKSSPLTDSRQTCQTKLDQCHTAYNGMQKRLEEPILDLHQLRMEHSSLSINGMNLRAEVNAFKERIASPCEPDRPIPQVLASMASPNLVALPLIPQTRDCAESLKICEKGSEEAQSQIAAKVEEFARESPQIRANIATKTTENARLATEVKTLSKQLSELRARIRCAAPGTVQNQDQSINTKGRKTG
ncbi:hypothetical protein B566_EDAN012569 [Ephemera danica]|nr:hypothetical protein B566_EDAN012569 [Ephemera danica]